MTVDPHLLWGSIALSLLHAAIPSHWLPLVLVGRSERWSAAQTVGAAALTGFAHTLSTIGIGLALGLFGQRVAAAHGAIPRGITAGLLALVGLVYLGLELEERGRRHHDHGISPEVVRGRSKGGMLAALAAAMFFSPCLEIEAYFFVAGGQGWAGIALVSLVYLLVTVSGMMVLVQLGLAGLDRLDLHVLDRHEHAFVGGALLVLAAVAYWVG